MDMTMDKNRLLGLLIIGLIVIAGIFYGLWLLFFNTGQLIIEGVPPFKLDIGNKSHICLENQCSYTLSAREYSYVISKEGYFEQSGFVSVQRGKRVFISYEAVFEAKTLTGVDYPMLSLPVGYSKYQEKLLDISLFHMIQNGYSLQRMPKKINNIDFSRFGNKAILFEDEGTYYYKTDNFEKGLIEDFEGGYSAQWNIAEDVAYSIAYDEESKKDALVRLNLDDLSTDKEIYFARHLEEYTLSVSPDEGYIALTDTTSGVQALYLVDRNQKSRTNVFEGYAIQSGQWSQDGDYYIFSGKKDGGGAPALWLLDAQNKKVEALGFNASARLVAGAPGGTFYFVSTDEYSLSGLSRPYFSTFKEVGEILTIDDLINDRVISLHLFNVQERQTYLILELTNIIPGVPEKIEVNDQGSILRMLVVDQYFDVKVGE